jgi:hypothetical protein
LFFLFIPDKFDFICFKGKLVEIVLALFEILDESLLFCSNACFLMTGCSLKFVSKDEVRERFKLNVAEGSFS